MEIGNWIKHYRWRLLGSIALAVGFLTLYVSGVQNVNALMQEIRDNQIALESKQYYNQELKFRITSLESPERINRIAIERLGMDKPDEVPRVLK